MSNSQICSVSELSALINAGSVKVLDCSWFLPNQNRDAVREFEDQHIIGAQFFDIDAISDPDSDLPHMLPTADHFATSVGELGISNTDLVVVYDSTGLFSAARAWWMFKVFGHESVQVLAGGLPAWVDANGELTDKLETVQRGNFFANSNLDLVIGKAELIRNCESSYYTVLDARPSARFMGHAPEPRPGLPSGHMPESVSFPFDQLIENGKLKSPKQLRALFSKKGVNETSPVITSCGSGVTAAIITLALAESGYGLKRLYDGSWAEWGAASDTIILARSTSD